MKPRLGDFFSSRQEPGKAGLPVMSVTMNDSLVLRDDMERRTESALTPEQHLLVKKGDIAYNMMRMWQGACGLAEADGIVSPAYVVLAPKPGMDSSFAYHWFKSTRMIYLFWAYSHGLTEDRLRLYFDAFSEIPASPPSHEQQMRISKVLDAWDQAINQTERLIVTKRQQRMSRIKSILIAQETKKALSKVVAVNMGQSPSSVDYNGSGNGLALVQGAGDFDEWGLRPTVWTTSAPKSAGVGSIIMSVRAPVGLATVSDREVCLGRGVCALNANTCDDAEFIFASLVCNSFGWTRLSQGTSFEAVGADQFDEFELAWPIASTRSTIGALHRTLFEEERRLRSYANSVRIQKRGLMQKLLTGEWKLGEQFQ
jgi:type I restriction enzyme S subunit